MIATLIIGGNDQKRQEAIETLLAPFSISSSDRILLVEEPSIGIEMIRSVQKQLLYKPLSGQTKAVIIPHADTLTDEAQQALLKTLEEPPIHTMIILAAETEEIFLPTILSRCRIMHLSVIKPILSAEKKQELHAFWELILKTNPISRLALIPELGKGKQVFREYLNEHILFLSEELQRNSSKFELPTISRILKSAITSLQYIESNINPRLTLDHFFLSV